MVDPDPIETPSGQLLSADERKRVLSAGRLKLTLTVFVVAILLGLSTMIFAGVSRIFDWLTPSIAADLKHKAQRGALELAQTAQLGLVARDREHIEKPMREYVEDADVTAIAAFDASGERLFAYGDAGAIVEVVLQYPSNTAHDLGSAYGAWAASEIEGAAVGKIVLVVSKSRLEAGMELRRQILIAAALGCLLALGACLLFVNLYIGPILNVTAQAFTRLEQTTEAALAAAKLKSHFLANMSHEIRTPMNGIIGVIDLLNRTELSNRQHRYVQIIESSARGLLTIINDVLDFSKLEAGKYELRADELELRLVAQEVMELLSPRAHDKGLELIARVDDAVPETVIGDLDRIKQVLHNLVGNAIKFTEHGHVALHVSHVRMDAAAAERDVTVRFAVSDTGPGIAREDQTRLFEVFTQVDGSLTRKHGGTGLGLAISKQLATAMDGKIGVDSEPGRGSTFWFTANVKAGDRVRSEPKHREARVLVVCPGQAQSELVREWIERWGMTCTLVTDANAGTALLVERPGDFDAVVLDGAAEGRASEPSGLLEVCLGEALPVIHLLSTAQFAEGTARRNYLQKPIRASELYDGLINVLSGGSVQQRARVSANVPKRNSVTAKRPPVLVVDDNEINRVVAVDLLQSLGYPAETATNGLEAVEKAATGTFAVVLMDCQMPELDGYEATQRIRSLPEPACSVPIVALTAHALAGDRDRALRAGMDDHATKPIRVRTLEQLLRRWEDVRGERRAANENGEPAEALEEKRAADSLKPPQLDALPDLDPALPRSNAVIELFLTSVPAQMESLEAAMAAGDPVKTKVLAHKLKGNCLSLGAAKLASAFHAIEAAAAFGQLHHEAQQLLPALFAAVAGELGGRSSSRAPGGRAGGTRHG